MRNNKSQYYIAEKQGNTETIIQTSYVVEDLEKRITLILKPIFSRIYHTKEN
jgi:hypothetical protein